jgi:hypothetical protein
MLQKLLLSEISVDEFDEWFGAASWNMHKDSSIEAQKMAGRVELLLAEFDQGHLSEGELRGRFLGEVRYLVISPKSDIQWSWSSTATATFIQPVLSVVSGKSHVKAPSYTPLLQEQC